MNRFKAKFYEGEAAEGLSKEERRERLKVYIDNVYAALPPNVRRTMPQIREDTQLHVFTLQKKFSGSFVKTYDFLGEFTIALK